MGLNPMLGEKQESVLVICSERSGSNLLKAILSQHPDIFIGPPIPLFECFRPIIDSYGDLGHDDNWLELIDDVVDLIAVNHQPLPCRVTRDQIIAATASGPRSWAELVRATYRIIAQSQGARMFGYKYSTNMQDLALFMAEMDFSHVIYQVRDPRDVVLSTVKTGFVDETPEEVARRWQLAQEHAGKALEAHPHGVLVQRYEDLLSDPKGTLGRIWSYLGVADCKQALTFHTERANREIAQRSHAWANVARPLMRRNYGKFYREWNLREVRGVEGVVASEMRRFGYKAASGWRFLGKSRKLEKRVLTAAENEFFRPQSEKWEEINRKARARREKSAC
ncbi:MAG: sulfotransferase [Gammaproteobacteria bacterium]|nr:sulfotransferase [Gammaproteobacteria bacterium]